MYPRNHLYSTKIPGTKGHHLPASLRQTNCTTMQAAMGWLGGRRWSKRFTRWVLLSPVINTAQLFTRTYY